ncbi:MAG: M67 family metallopeptidase [Gammaproteobacteria bacterium]|nr:M67 family metallopeptidase [Gammaproteobacteria bacterium]
MNDALTLPRHTVNQLLAAAQAIPAEEVCGFIATAPDGEHRVYPVANIADDRRCYYQMDPAQQIAALRAMRDGNEQLLCIYHSHPQGPAHPSQTDRHEANYPEAIYLIISLQTGGVLELRAFRIITPDSVTELALQIGD